MAKRAPARNSRPRIFPEVFPMTAPAIPAPAKGRLGNGQLRRQVAEWLAARPGPHTVGEIAKDLGRSAGAVGNALTTLADRAEAARLPGKPIRYEANAATAAAAAAITPKAPSPPKAAPAAPPVAPKSAASPAPPAAPKPVGAPASPAAPKAAPSAKPGPVTRPGGQVYRPRVLAGMADVEALRTLRAEGVPSLLAGPPGTGKTSLVEAAFPDLITVAGDGDTTVGDFVGEYTQKPDGSYEFIYGPLIRAMQEGRVLFIDDATLISPAVLAVCYPALDGRREVIVKAHKGETITAADGFYVVAGHNPGVHGAVLTEALSSRFTFQFDVATDFDLARSLGIDSRAITAARNLATRQANGETGWAPQLRELLAFAKITKIFGLDTALANLAGVAPAEDRDVVADTLAKTFGKTVAPLSLGRQI
jgi:nitric oxide reductase NorQ protein